MAYGETAAQRAEREMRERCAKHEVDLYQGRGIENPSITTRLDRLEISKVMSEKKAEQIYGRINVMIAVVGSLAVAILMQLIFKH